ncbi:MAG: hypothetical protein K2L59_06820, partial [Muribaculaceae bacterium]|nr:hypothetical protein [Muribaculaceae bacterium]
DGTFLPLSLFSLKNFTNQISLNNFIITNISYGMNYNHNTGYFRTEVGNRSAAILLYSIGKGCLTKEK